MDGECIRKSKLLLKLNHKQHSSSNKKNFHKNISREKFIFQCGLEKDYNVFSDDNEMDICMEGKRADNECQKVSKIPIKEQRKVNVISKENAKIQAKTKDLLNDLAKKDDIIGDFNSKNSHLKMQLEEQQKVNIMNKENAKIQLNVRSLLKDSAKKDKIIDGLNSHLKLQLQEQQKVNTMNKENAKIQLNVRSLLKDSAKKDKIIDDLNSNNSHLKLQLQEQQKVNTMNKENAKIQLKVRSLLKDLAKKDKIINDLNSSNSHLKLQLQQSKKDSDSYNFNLIELANSNNRLNKEIERKNLEMSEIKLKMSRNELVNSNLLKDIDFYKAELNAAKTENLTQSQKHDEQEYENLQKKFFSIKIENAKLCRKFKQIRLSGDENDLKNLSYHVLTKKYETIQRDANKLKTENKTLKKEIRLRKQMFEDERSQRIATTKCIAEEIENLTNIKTKAEEANEKFETMLAKAQAEQCISKSLIIDLQGQLEEKIINCRQQEAEIKNLKATCTQLENKIQVLLSEKEEVMRQHFINEENNNILKLKLNELTREKTRLVTSQCSSSQTMEDKDLCENCLLLKQEVEKLGYANLRINKEKHNLQSNFQKLAIKTSKLTLKIEKLEMEKQTQQEHEGDMQYESDQHLLQNVLLSKRLHNLLKRSEKLFKVHVVHQKAKSDKDFLTLNNSSDKIIDELNANLNYSKSNLETIESKLNEEEWKLNSALKHIRSVKEQIQKEI